MDRGRVIAALKAHEQELRTAGVLSVSVFGSVARGEHSTHDVDVAVRLSENFPAPGLNYFSRLSELEGRLSGILGVFKQRSTGTAPLPSDKPARRLEDIVENAQAKRHYVAGMDAMQSSVASNGSARPPPNRVIWPRPSCRVSPGRR